MTSFLTLARKRASIRAYRSEAVDTGLVEQVLEAGRLAPTAKNLQAWQVVVVRDAQQREALCRAYPGKWLDQAGIVVMLSRHRLRLLGAAMLMCSLLPASAVNTGRVDIADSPDRRGYGWHAPETVHGRRASWMDRLESDIFIVCAPPRERTVEITCAPLFYPFRQQNVAVFINRQYIAEWVCPHDAAFRSYTVTVPGRFWREGANTLTLRVGYLRRSPPDRRELGLAVERVRWWPR